MTNDKPKIITMAKINAGDIICILAHKKIECNHEEEKIFRDFGFDNFVLAGGFGNFKSDGAGLDDATFLFYNIIHCIILYVFDNFRKFQTGIFCGSFYLAFFVFKTYKNGELFKYYFTDSLIFNRRSVF